MEDNEDRKKKVGVILEIGFILLWLFFGFLSMIVASNKKQGACAGFIIGAILGPIGFLIVLVLPKNKEAIERSAIKSGKMKKCPYCAELIRKEASVCKYCNKAV